MFQGPVQGDAKRALLRGHRFGIHCRSHEPFGIAVAELAAAGCVTFVPDGGGQVEIVDHPDLIYTSPEAAIEKIDISLVALLMSAYPALVAVISLRLGYRFESPRR